MRNQDFFAEMMMGEFDRFRNVIAALPADKLDYRHDPRARSARQLVSHLLGHFQDIVELLDDGVIHSREEVPFTGIAEALAIFDAAMANIQARVPGITDGAWAREGEFFVGDEPVMAASQQTLAWMMFLDAVHHRGQLTTLIRPMGGKVPAIYGPSADTAMV